MEQYPFEVTVIKEEPPSLEEVYVKIESMDSDSDEQDMLLPSADNIKEDMVMEPELLIPISTVDIKIDKNEQIMQPRGCEQCGQCFPTPLALTSHKLTCVVATSGKSFICTKCTGQFTSKRLLSYHVKWHCGVTRSKRKTKSTSRRNELSCYICSQEFKLKSDLVVHKRMHSGKETFPCDLCDRQFGRNSQLIIHKRSHTGEKPFSCDICEKRFGRNVQLVVHKRVHSGEKPFKCDVCNKQFRNKQYLGVHKQIHMEDRPYQCDICDRQFLLKHHLVTHKRIHNKEKKPSKCKLNSRTEASVHRNLIP